HRAGSPVVAGTARASRRRSLRHDAGAAAVRRTWQVIAADVVGQGNVGLRIGADPRHRHFQREDFRAAERLDDFRARVRPSAATVENAAGMEVSHLVGERMPPLRSFAAELIQLEHAVRLSPARIVGDAPAGDQRPCAVVNDPSLLVLVHAKEDEMPREISRLRNAADDRRFDLARERIRRAEIVGVSPEWLTRSLGKYGIGLPITLSGAATVPLRLMIRPRIFPVTPVSTGVTT